MSGCSNCHVSVHLAAGMQAFFEVLPREAPRWRSAWDLSDGRDSRAGRRELPEEAALSVRSLQTVHMYT